MVNYTEHLSILAASTTSYSAYGQPCVVCKYPAQAVVVDYSEVEGNLGEEHLVPLCGAHMRLALFTRLDGTTVGLDEALDEVRKRLGLYVEAIE